MKLLNVTYLSMGVMRYNVSCSETSLRGLNHFQKVHYQFLEVRDFLCCVDCPSELGECIVSL
ncbi:unnamed protein product [Ixodes persulcatus]